MNTRSQVNNDATSHALMGTVAAASSATAAPAAADRKEPQARPEKAMGEPDANAAIPRDEHHNKGGMYALVDGKRVPADDEGKPLPLDAQGNPVRPDAGKK